jgi:hypothetical protein
MNAATAIRAMATRAPSSRRSAKRRRVPTKREVAVYRGQTYLGTVKLAGKASAYAPNGKRVGVFTSLEAATDALDKPEAIE